MLPQSLVAARATEKYAAPDALSRDPRKDSIAVLRLKYVRHLRIRHAAFVNECKEGRFFSWGGGTDEVLILCSVFPSSSSSSSSLSSTNQTINDAWFARSCRYGTVATFNYNVL